MPTFFTEGDSPRRNDTKWKILQKILSATIDGGGGGDPETAEQLHGNGSPEGVVSAKIGQHYFDDTNDVIYWKESGDGTNTGWI